MRDQISIIGRYRFNGIYPLGVRVVGVEAKFVRMTRKQAKGFVPGLKGRSLAEVWNIQSELGWLPMNIAPRDGTKIRVRRKHHPNLKFHEAVAKWAGQFWRLQHNGQATQDDYLTGWKYI